MPQKRKPITGHDGRRGLPLKMQKQNHNMIRMRRMQAKHRKTYLKRLDASANRRPPNLRRQHNLIDKLSQEKVAALPSSKYVNRANHSKTYLQRLDADQSRRVQPLLRQQDARAKLSPQKMPELSTSKQLMQSRRRKAYLRRLDGLDKKRSRIKLKREDETASRAARLQKKTVNFSDPHFSSKSSPIPRRFDARGEKSHLATVRLREKQARLRRERIRELSIAKISLRSVILNANIYPPQWTFKSRVIQVG